ncbi:MAG: hypothetical protein ACQEQC_08525 [Elusimicrobiota bacterium]
MIEDNIKIHDRYQFEIKFDYTLDEEEKSSSYNIESYIFIPDSLDINRYTYKKEDFYSDIQSYIRFKTPSVILRNLAAGENSPLYNLKRNYKNIADRQNKNTISLYKYHTKMFCCIVKSSLRDHVNFIRQTELEKDLNRLFEEYIDEVKKVTSKFRDLRSIVNIPGIERNLFSVYLFADEYISHLVEQYTHELIEVLKDKRIDNFKKYRKKLIKLVKKELKHRKVNDYPSIPRAGDDNEEFLFRRSVLKKYMGSILFLNTQSSRAGKLFKQLLFGIAAGTAMIFTLIVTFYSQSKFGNYSLPFVMIAVIAYMFKDRIKGLLKTYFSKKLTKSLYDYKFNIFTGPEDKIGYSKTSADFIKENKIPEKVKKIRNRDHITEIEGGWKGEKILLYRKKIKIFSKNFKRVYRSFKINGINDIIRLNISRFLQKMDDPDKQLYTVKDKKHRRITGQRVYHLNMVMKYMKDKDTTYKRFRIVLNRKGIKRIEEVDTEVI